MHVTRSAAIGAKWKGYSTQTRRWIIVAVIVLPIFMVFALGWWNASFYEYQSYAQIIDRKIPSMILVPHKLGRFGNTMLIYCNARLMAALIKQTFAFVPNPGLFFLPRYIPSSKINHQEVEPYRTACLSRVYRMYRNGQKLGTEFLLPALPVVQTWFKPLFLEFPQPPARYGALQPTDWVFHIRLGDVFEFKNGGGYGHYVLPLSFYTDMVPEIALGSKLLILAESPRGEIESVAQFFHKKYNRPVFVQSTTVMEDFMVLCHAPQAVGSLSTFTAFAALLNRGQQFVQPRYEYITEAFEFPDNIKTVDIKNMPVVSSANVLQLYESKVEYKSV